MIPGLATWIPALADGLRKRELLIMGVQTAPGEHCETPPGWTRMYYRRYGNGVSDILYREKHRPVLWRADPELKRLPLTVALHIVTLKRAVRLADSLTWPHCP